MIAKCGNFFSRIGSCDFGKKPGRLPPFIGESLLQIVMPKALCNGVEADVLRSRLIARVQAHARIDAAEAVGEE